jgi:glycerate kinase
MKVVVAPDSFKGSTTAMEAALAISKEIWKEDPETGDITELYQKGLSAAFSITRDPLVLQKSMEAAGELLEQAAENVARLWKAAAFVKVAGRYETNK